MLLPVVEALRDLERALSGLGLRWYLFGAQAAIIHGAVRVTAGVDVTVELGELSAAQLAEAVRSYGFAPRFERGEAGLVGRGRVLLVVHERTSLPVDLALAGPGLEQVFFEGVEPMAVEGFSFPVASAEDMVVMKLLAGRPQDIEDVEDIVAARREAMDFQRVEWLLDAVEQAFGRKDLLPKLEWTRWHR